VPDHKLQVIARDDDTTFGILLSKWHLAWSLRVGSWHGIGNDPRYTIGACFETFPFPKGLTPNIPAKRFSSDPRAVEIAEAAKRLDTLRSAWLNPPDLVRIEPEVVPGYPHRILPKEAQAAPALRKRTLTNLYNLRPQWLTQAHRDLDAAVAVAYGWTPDITEEDALSKLLELNTSRSVASAVATTFDRKKQRERSLAPEQARQSPQFRLTIEGGNHAVKNVSAPIIEPKPRAATKRKSA
jgi:hypothetical protein